MATNKLPIFLSTVEGTNISITNAEGTTAEVMFTASADGGAVVKLSAVTDDTSDVIAVLRVSVGAVDNIIGEVTVPAGAGTDGTVPAKNLLDKIAMPGVLQADGSLLMGAGAILTVGAKAAVTAAKTLDVIAQGGQYSA